MILSNRQIRVSLFESFKNSFFRKIVGITFLLLLILLVNAFILIVVRFEYKLKLNQHKDLIVFDSKLDEEWSQIILEYSFLATSISFEKFDEKSHIFLPTEKILHFLHYEGDSSTNE